jgi:hypothetical protein
MIMKMRIAGVVCTFLLLCPVLTHGEVWSLGDDFSGTQNPNGVWSFGWRDTPEQPLTLFTDNSPLNDCDLWWWWDGQMNLGVWHNFHDYPYHCTSIYDYPPHTTYFHPGPTQQSVVRWTAPQDMTVQLAAHFALWDFGFGGTEIVRVYANGTELFSTTLSDLVLTADYATSRTVRSGDVIECAVDPISYYYDTTQLTFTVETAGPPTGACCFPSGVCLLGSEADCVTAGGAYTGDGTSCDPNPCESTPVKSTTWGEAKSLFR